ncbi:L,D-transpeptidase [bacterium]|nr:L,D-transpeptidase [bacterium]
MKVILWIIPSLFLLAELYGYYLGGWREPKSVLADNPNIANKYHLEQLRAKNMTLKRKLARNYPRNPFLIIDTSSNKLFLKSREKTVLEAVISAGSGNILINPVDNKQWVFDTPRGEFLINSKLVAPVWKKPDWAFIEEGITIPDKQNDRMENGALGEYAMGFGDGYFIHGTLYTRLLGRNVTHGCIRVGEENLRSIFQSVRIGTQIYII